MRQSTLYLSVPKVSRKVIGAVAELDCQYLMHPSARVSTKIRLNGSKIDFTSRLFLRLAISHPIRE